MHNQQDKLNLREVYSHYFGNMRTTYLTILNRAIELKEIKHTKRIEKYADFLVGLIFGLSILYKIKNKQELQQHIDQQLALIL